MRKKNETKIHLFLRQFYFTKHSLIPNTSERVSRVNWFSSGLQNVFRESIGSARGFRVRFASQLVQFGTSERVSQIILSQIIWFRWELRSAYRKSFYLKSFDSDLNLGSAYRKSFDSDLNLGSAERKSFDSSRRKKTRRALMIRKLNVILWCSRHFTIHTFCLWPE